MITRWQKILFTLGTLIFGWFFLLFRGRKHLNSRPNPVSNYNESVNRINRIIEKEESFISKKGRTSLLTHNKKKEWVVVLLHGYTNCPWQYNKLGMEFYELGCNVYIPRMPHHGLQNRNTNEHAKLTASSLTTYADSVIDMAGAFGDKLAIVGISAGALLAGWLSLSRRDVSRCILVSPMFGFNGFPSFIIKPLMNMLLTLPNFFKWSEAEKKAVLQPPEHVYTRYSSRALGELLWLGFEVQRLLYIKTVTDLTTHVITNANDNVVNNNMTNRILRLWQKRHPGSVFAYEFVKSLHLDHDLIDPEHENQQTELVYQVIINRLMSGD